MKRFADFIIGRRALILTFVAACTVFFMFNLRNLNVRTIFADLLPQNHEYTKVHNAIRDMFGAANQVLIMVQVKDPEKGGTYNNIFNVETLLKIKFITEEAQKFTSVDQTKINSIAHRKIRDFRTTREFKIRSLMFPDVPTTAEGLHDLRLAVYANPMVYPGMVSLDSKSALITLDFVEDKVDYGLCFRQLQELRKKTEDANHTIAIAGEPMHLGYIDSYTGDVMKILLITAAAMMAVFFLYFRTKRGMLLPVVSAGVSAIWGMGFLSLLNINLDPLVLVLPFLVAAKAASHVVQIINRHEEETAKTGDAQEASKKVIQSLFAPGLTDVATDVVSIIIVALTPIAILQKICILCTFWAFATVLVAMILVPILLSYMPVRKRQGQEGLLAKMLMGIGRWVAGTGKYIILPASIILFIWASLYAGKVSVGNPVPGSEVLWPFHRYNADCFRISFSMPRLNPLYIVLDTGAEGGALEAPAVRDMSAFARYMQAMPGHKVIAALVLQNLVPVAHRWVWESNPKWEFLPDSDAQTLGLFAGITSQGGSGAWSSFQDSNDWRTNMIVYCRDKTTETVREVIARARQYIDTQSILPDAKQKYRLAGGAMGVQAAINETLKKYQLLTMLLAFLGVFISCSVLMRSMVGGLILLLPVILSNTVMFACMALCFPPIPITTATLPVSAISVGIGVDFAIYLASRIREECAITGDLKASIIKSLGTTGKAVVYFALTLICGLFFWIFSKLMFPAVMAFMLSASLLLNSICAIFIVPSLILFIKPKCILFPAVEIKNGKPMDIVS